MAIAPADENPTLPGANLSIKKMPGHWLLARFGKRVLRPGGREMTEDLLKRLSIHTADDVVELAPGLGVTAKLILSHSPHSYTGVEHDEDAAAFTRDQISDSGTIVVGKAQATGLADACASVVIGEAMLSMQSQSHKEDILREALRILRPGGRYGVHELVVVPDDISEELEKEISTALSSSIHVGARPLSERAWKQMFESQGFVDIQTVQAPMHLLEPQRLIADEGFSRAIGIVTKIMLNPDARQRVLEMRQTFKRYEQQLKAIAIVAHKPHDDNDNQSRARGFSH